MSILDQLSGTLVEATQSASQFVVAVSGGARFGASGVIWQPGTVVTTRSTIRRDEKLTITLPAGDVVPATLAGHDSGTDIAVLTYDSPGPSSPPAVTSEARAGELILAVGRSENTGVNAALGLVSAVGPGWQTWQGGKIDAYLRLDIGLYPGGSGAAVINTGGALLGMVTGALSRIAPLAIPAATIGRIASELLSEGSVRRPWLGVAVEPVPLPSTLAEAAQSLTSGLVVLNAATDTPAGAAGIIVGDILLSIDDTPLQDPMELRHLLATRKPGEEVRVVLLRGGERRELTVTLGYRNGRH
jgi:S1-C subfamily serine protease